MHIHPVGFSAMWMPWKSTLSRAGLANAHGHPPWMPWKSTLSRSTLIGPGFANAHAYRPSLSQSHGCRLPWSSVLGLVPGFASAHGNPHIFAVPWMPWKPTLSQSTLIGPGLASAHGHPQIFVLPWMPWKSTLSKPTLIEPGLANAHAYPPSLCQCHGCRLPWSSVLGLVPGVANAHGNPQISAVPWMPWKSTLSKSTRIEPGFANAHAYPPVSMPWMQTTLVFCVRAGARLCQCPWKSTNLCSAMGAMETHTIPVYPYRARVCQRPCISTQSDSVPCGCHGNPHYPGQGLPMPMDIHHGCHGNPHYPSLPL